MKKITALILSLAMLLSLAACGSGNDSEAGSVGSTGTKPTAQANAAEPEQNAPAANASAVDAQPVSSGPRTLRIGTTESSGSFDPWSGTSGPQNYLAFETITMRTGSGEYEPWLAESVEWVDDTTMEIKLRDDAKFANGEPVLGEDIVYTFEKSATGTSVMAVHFSVIDFEKSTVSDDGLTVDFKLKQPYGPLMAYLDIPYVVDKSQCEDWDSNDERWWDSPPTSSAYEITENVSGSHTTFKLREDYWNKDRMPDWDEIIINYYSDPTAMFIAFENDELDLVLGVSNNDIGRLESGSVQNAENVAYELKASNAAYLFCMSDSREEFHDPKVREAIANVIDCDAVGQVAFGGYYELCDSVICSGTKYYKSCGTYDKGVDYAKECMAESKYPDGFAINVVSTEGDAPIWEVVQDSLSKIGITVNVSTYDMATCIPMWMEEGGTDAMVMTCAGGNMTGEPYADLSANWKNGQLKAARVMDEEYNELFEKFVYNTDDATRKEYCEKVQQWLYDNCQCIPLAQPSYCFAYRSDRISSCDFFSGTRANMLYCHAK